MALQPAWTQMTAETDAKHPSSSLEETIGRKEQKLCIFLPSKA
jgi:hypothetical protein